MIRTNYTFGAALMAAFCTLVGSAVAGEDSVSVSFTGAVIRAEAYADEKLPKSVAAGSGVTGTIEISGSDSDKKIMRQYDGVSWTGVMKVLTFDGAFTAEFYGGNLIKRTAVMLLRTANCEGVCSAAGAGFEATSSDSKKLVFVPSGYEFSLAAFNDPFPDQAASLQMTAAALAKLSNSGKAEFVVRFVEKSSADPLKILVGVKSMKTQ